MSKITRTLCLLLLLSGLLITPAAAQSGTFEETPCMITPLSLTVDTATLKCGYLTVPQQHADPTGPQIRLAVVIIPSSNPNPAPDPVVVAQGGPGGSTIETYGVQALFLLEPFLQNRDVILFDQRGTLYAEPNLRCTESLALTLETIEQHLTMEEALTMQLEALQRCRQRLTEQNINLAAYNSLENAADVDALRQALGYEQINFYGVSYGTLLGLHLMRNYPASLRSVILDAVVPAQTNFVTHSLHSQNRAFNQLFAACTADALCNEHYPDLETTLFAVAEQLNEQPATMPLLDTETGLSYDAVLDGDTFLAILFQLLYPTDFLPFLPKLITDASHGDYRLLTPIWSLLAFDRTFSEGMYNSVLCAEDADFTVADVIVSDVRAQLRQDYQLEFETLLEACAAWNVPYLGPALDVPVASSVPTLLLSGRFDPITPPDFAATAAQTLATAYSYTFPTTAHGALGQACPNQIIADFLADPLTAPPATCLANQPPGPEFVTPGNTILFPLFAELVQLSGWAWATLGLYFVSVIGLLSAWLIFPLIFLVNYLNRTPDKLAPPTPWPAILAPPTPWPAILAKIDALLVGMLGLLFLLGLLAAGFYAGYYNQMMLFVGLPSSFTPLFLLPPLLLLLIGGMVIAAMLSWWRGYWSVFSRIYYTMLTLAALVTVGILFNWGMLTTLF